MLACLTTLGLAASQRKEVPMNNRPQITSVLRSLAVGEVAKFPIERAGSVKATINRLTTELMRSNWKVLTFIDSDNYKILVERVK